MENDTILNFINSYLQYEEEDIKIIEDELKEAGIDGEQEEKKFLEFLQAEKIKYKIESGKNYGCMNE